MKKFMRAQKSMRAGDGKQCIYLEWPNDSIKSIFLNNLFQIYR